ncbi:hypothetical protein P7K49_032289 [Saguinus oedipus]|uniref:Uncharacterized protein n=1 Tax=Saguinus oedipus TaxID=9490 RepID=A0ABQ9TXU6_SAGOE|nr:hypothetical protein P7K49_032289 [Saguinus oedipus]
MPGPPPGERTPVPSLSTADPKVSPQVMDLPTSLPALSPALCQHSCRSSLLAGLKLLPGAAEAPGDRLRVRIRSALFWPHSLSRGRRILLRAGRCGSARGLGVITAAPPRGAGARGTEAQPEGPRDDSGTCPQRGQRHQKPSPYRSPEDTASERAT